MAASKEAEVLLAKITASTTIAEKEKAKVAVIVSSVTSKAQVGAPAILVNNGCCCCLPSTKHGFAFCLSLQLFPYCACHHIVCNPFTVIEGQ